MFYLFIFLLLTDWCISGFWQCFLLTLNIFTIYFQEFLPQLEDAGGTKGTSSSDLFHLPSHTTRRAYCFFLFFLKKCFGFWCVCLSFTSDIKELMQEQGSSNVIVASAHREILRQSSQDAISKSATIHRWARAASRHPQERPSLPVEKRVFLTGPGQKSCDALICNLCTPPECGECLKLQV